jgi:hypothetical protein
MNSGCAAIFGPGVGDGPIEGAGDACPGEGELADVVTAGDGDAARVATSAMIARSGTDASIHAGVVRQI